MPLLRSGRGLLALAVIWAALATSAFALDPRKAMSQYVHNSWSTNEGLPQDSVNAVVQTSDGYLWIATQEGLARFDGVRFTVFDASNTRGALGNFVYSLFADRDGSLWIGAGGGLLRYRSGTFQRFDQRNGLADVSGRHFAQDAAAGLWIGHASEGTTGGKGLARFKDGKGHLFTTKDGLSSDQVYPVLTGRDGSLWIGTGAGLDRLKAGKITRFALPGTLIRALCEDRRGNLWIGTPHGLSRMKDGAITTFTTRDGLSDNSILAIQEDRDGQIWIGTEHGLNRVRDGRIEAVTIAGLADDAVFALLEGHEGSLWIGTHAGGLHRLRDGKFAMLGVPEGLAGNSVGSILQDRAGRIWIGNVPGGLNVLENGTIRTYTKADGLSNENIRALYEDREGVLWVGTSDGLDRFKENRFSSDRSAGTVLSIFEDAGGARWIGTTSGLFRTNDGVTEAVTLDRRPFKASVRFIYQDRAGRLWAGGSFGLAQFENGTLVPLRIGALNRIDINLQSIHEDADGALWIGTWSQGLQRLKDGHLTTFTTANGLYDDVAWSILEDDAGNLWMGSNRGIYRVSRAQLNAFADGRIKAVTSTVFGTSDGMRKRETNAGSPAAMRSRDGRLWFGTTAGAAVVDPKSMPMNRVPPPVVLEDVIADGKRVANNAYLRPGTRSIEFHYAGLSFVSPEKVTYRYKLEGFSNDWVEADTRRVAYYTNIGPGSYRFRVIAANDDGVWNETGASFAFELRPYFYETRWFYALAIVGLMLLGVALNALRERQMQIRHQVHHDALTGLANRVLFERRTSAAMALARKTGSAIAILFLDLDDFKAVNDTLGHAAGDTVLQWTAKRLRACVRDGDTMARIGGDEFAVLVATLDDDGHAIALAERMIAAMRDPYVINDRELLLGVSIGIAIHKEGEITPEELLQTADKAMYRAKVAGGNGYLCDT
jgi:diguanylate cyclase (GGDEF)-like protein